MNIYPVKGYSITVKMDDPRSRDAAPWTSLLDDEAKIVTARLGDDRLRVAGTAEFNGYNYDIRADRIRPLTRWVNENFPDVSTKCRGALGWVKTHDAQYDASCVPKGGDKKQGFITTQAMVIWAGR